MKMHLTGAVMMACGLLFFSGCASAPKASQPVASPPAAPKEDIASMQGTWTGHEVEGPAGECRLTITGNVLKFQGARAEEWYHGKLTLLPNTTPKRADVLIQECGAPTYNQLTAKAIYKLEGNTLTIGATEPGEEAPPTSLEPGNRGRIFVFTRP